MVEGFLEQLHQIEARVAEGAAEEGLPREADAVFARDRAAEAAGEVEDFLHREFHARHLGGVFFVGEEGRG
jgi:hypothetical protein